MSIREVPNYLIKKYHLSMEDADDVRSEIAISDLKYGYQRNIEHIIIDYFEKFKHYKRNRETGKREFKAVFVEYAEDGAKSILDGRDAKKFNGYYTGCNEDGDVVTRRIEQNSELKRLYKLIENLPYKKRKIIDGILNDESLCEIAAELRISESRASQLYNNVIDKSAVLNILPESVAYDLLGIVKW